MIHGNVVSLHYSLDDQAGQPLVSFVEQVEVDAEVDPTDDRVLAVLDVLALCAGTSYYKVAAPPIVHVDIVHIGHIQIGVLIPLHCVFLFSGIPWRPIVVVESHGRI